MMSMGTSGRNTRAAAAGNNSRSPAKIKPIRESASKPFVRLEEIKLKEAHRLCYLDR